MWAGRTAKSAIGTPPGECPDIARRAVTDALAGLPGVVEVEAAVDDGTVAVTVVVGTGTDTDAIAATLGRYALAWDIEERS